MLSHDAESGELRPIIRALSYDSNDADMQPESGCPHCWKHFLEGLMRLAIMRPGKAGGNSARIESVPRVALSCAASITVLIALKLSLF